MTNSSDFEVIPQNRTEFLNFVRRIAREDVDKCLAGVHVTHPQLLQEIQKKRKEMLEASYPSSVLSPSPSSHDEPNNNISKHQPSVPKQQQQQTRGTNAPNLQQKQQQQQQRQQPRSQQQQINTGPSIATIHQPTETRTAKHVTTRNERIPVEQQPINTTQSPRHPSPTPSDVSDASARARERALKAYEKHVKRRTTKKKEDNDEVDHARNTKHVSDHLLKPTFSIAQKQIRRNEQPVSPPQALISDNFREKRKQQNRATSLLLRPPPTTGRRRVFNHHQSTTQYTAPSDSHAPCHSVQHDRDNDDRTMYDPDYNEQLDMVPSQEDDYSSNRHASHQYSHDQVRIDSDGNQVPLHFDPVHETVPVSARVFHIRDDTELHPVNEISTPTATEQQTLPITSAQPSGQQNLLNQLEDKILDEIMRGVAQEETNDKIVLKNLLQQKVELSCTSQMNENKLNEILGLLEAIEEQEQEIRDRLNEGYQRKIPRHMDSYDTYDEEDDSTSGATPIESENAASVLPGRGPRTVQDTTVHTISKGTIYSTDRDITTLEQNRKQYAEYKKWARYSADTAPRSHGRHTVQPHIQRHLRGDIP